MGQIKEMAMADITNNTPNLTPSSSPELGRLFKLGQSVDEAKLHSPAPAELPSYQDVDVPIEVIEEQQMGPTATTRPQLETTGEVIEHNKEEIKNKLQHSTGSQTEEEPEPPSSAEQVSRRILRAVKKLAPYLVVFIIGLALYTFYFKTFSFTSLLRTSSSVEDTNKVDSAALAALQSTEADNYNSWISQFFFDVSDTNIIGMNTDVSGNGLTNFQKYLLNLNPKMYDTLGDNVGDGQKIIDGKNPWTGNALTESQQKLADTYFDKELISNRIAAAHAKHENEAFAPFVSNHSPYYQPGVSNIVNGDSALARSVSSPGEVAGASTNNTDNTPAPTNSNIRGNTGTPSTPAPTPTASVRSTPAPVQTAYPGINNLGIDTSVPGKVSIPSINATVPLVWSQDPKNFEADLKKGVIHYPGTPLPGEMGTSYVSGHSSGYFWDKSQYKVAFARLGDVKNGETFTITVTLKGGKQAILHYRVDGRAEYSAEDPRQFLQSSDSVVALSTCWPLNTTARRLVLFGVLTKVEK